MPIKVLIKEKNELRLRVVGESHTSLQMLRERLNKHKDIEYANYFPGHPELDDPEFYIRTAGKKTADKVLNDLVASIAKEFTNAKL
ncbi:MAG: DNA-directed RNA polymerase subunit L [Euryarchaeota archaeon]|jgi:DNA-directed RNA polymerase subunit L|nr:DNA-directed RNA polymerase subunit L [Euryarchaeota archaeon]MBT7986893.1 DNA-directed RNA polymerase subunit L [Euryarchaeota archaeon]